MRATSHICWLSTNCCILFNKATAWLGTELFSAAESRLSPGVAVLDGKLYVLGGCIGMTNLNAVERWDPIVRTWNYVSPMFNCRMEFGVTVLDGRLYAIGGYPSDCTVESYDPETNKWCFRAPMNRCCGQVGVTAENGFVYALSGTDRENKDMIDSVERYDPSTD